MRKSKKTLSANKKTKVWDDENIDFARVEKEIDENMFANDSTKSREQRMLEISKKLKQKEENENQSDNESTSSGILKLFCISLIKEFSDIERNVADKDVEENLGKVEWGRNQKMYYGADTQTETLKKASTDAQWQELRDEEKIGLQMQKNLAKTSRKELIRQYEFFDDYCLSLRLQDQLFFIFFDFYDKEILSLMKEWITQEHEAEKQNEKSNSFFELCCKIYRKKIEMLEIGMNTMTQYRKKISKYQRKNQNTQFEPVNEVPMEKIVKNWTAVATEEDVMDIVRRDHPELPGIVTELKVTIQEMENVNSIRKKAISEKFTNAVNDATMFLDLLRTYASILCFFLKLKVSLLWFLFDSFSLMINLVIRKSLHLSRYTNNFTHCTRSVITM
ncbi:hypothetical protein RFI_16687 [Reticulomyxa filosa]|uniref:Uncharacterized protein n=1 Tax=Reticulomyxa filosa TaxID=46433 RepID=X6N2P4_RETFI|nr:hypothetical protein RFI_16687 [Reticulomyxa filosa]|eukprot:ETO20535.1 hypothetical protein RFI_16687 [Reticulomyxa filosa]